MEAPTNLSDEASNEVEVDADEAVEALRTALERVHLRFPSMRNGGTVLGRDLVELGGCSAAVVAQLAVVVNAGVDALALRTPEQ
ncbi:hypothetical protein [Streptomyces sp. NPDC014733]|uniref:hypothetical protein n=1 Tax=Streptomyces sp. NPDC014733 TaxID=3364885 RepID=UPI0036F991DC